MSNKKRTTPYQYEPLVTPSKWSGDELRFSVRLTQILDDLYQKFSGLRNKANEPGGITEETDPTVPEWAKQENPPEQKVLSVNGKEGAVVLNANNVGAAPTGYGLGGSSTQIDDWNTAIANGFYRSSASCINGPTAGSQYHGMMINYSSALGNQLVFKTWTDGSEIWSRRYYNGNFESWELVYPAKVNTHTVTVNTAFVNTGNIKAHSVNGVLTVGGYFQTKASHAGDGSTTTVICTINDAKVKGQMYATINTHANGRAFNILMFTDTSTNKTVVQIDLAPYTISSGTWINFGIVGIVEV